MSDNDDWVIHEFDAEGEEGRDPVPDREDPEGGEGDDHRNTDAVDSGDAGGEGDFVDAEGGDVADASDDAAEEPEARLTTQPLRIDAPLVPHANVLRPRLVTLLCRLADYDRKVDDDEPRESWQYVMAALPHVGGGDFNMKAAHLDLHRLYFPAMGERGREARHRMERGEAVQISFPPSHPFFNTALKFLTKNGTYGPESAGRRWGENNVVGLARCILGGFIIEQPGAVAGRGFNIASLTHSTSGPRHFGAWLAMFAYFWLRSMSPTGMGAAREAIAKIRDVLDNDGPAVLTYCQNKVEMGALDTAGFAVKGLPTVEDACRAIGGFFAADRWVAPEVRPWRSGVLSECLAPMIEPFALFDGIREHEFYDDVVDAVDHVEPDLL